MSNWSVDTISDDTYRTKFKEVPRVIAEWVSDYGGLTGRDILDFGCGEATTALGIALQHGARRVVGVEIHDEIANALPFAKQQLGLEKLPGNLELFRVAENASLSGLGDFDVVYSWSVFEHVRQDLVADCFTKIKGILRPNGVMFLQTTPLYYSAEGSHVKPWIPTPWAHLIMQQDLFYRVLRQHTDSKQQADHLQWVYENLNRATAPQLLRAACQAGFEVIRDYRTYDNFPIPPELREVYTEDALTTNQLVFLARHSIEQAALESDVYCPTRQPFEVGQDNVDPCQSERSNVCGIKSQVGDAFVLCERLRRPNSVADISNVPDISVPVGPSGTQPVTDEVVESNESFRSSLRQLELDLSNARADIVRLAQAVDNVATSLSNLRRRLLG